jgi:predicted protein tyrosine phosphatase
MNKTDAIFELSAPYDNPFQGNARRLLFVCSAGLLRSATGANLWATKGANTRSCGTHFYALTPLSANLILWAHKIIFVNDDNYKTALNTFQEHGTLQHALFNKSIVLSIEDDYSYNDPHLVHLFETQLNEDILDK